MLSREISGAMLSAHHGHAPIRKCFVEEIGNRTMEVGWSTVLLKKQRLFKVFKTLEHEPVLQRVEIGNSRYSLLSEKERPLNFRCRHSTKHIYIGAITDMFNKGARIFSLPDPQVVTIDMSGEMEYCLVSEDNT
jgi:hypothetical protein